MSTNATAELPIDLAARKLYITTRLAGQLVDELEDLEAHLVEGSLTLGPLTPAELRGRVDDLSRLAAVVLDELRELELG